MDGTTNYYWEIAMLSLTNPIHKEKWHVSSYENLDSNLCVCVMKLEGDERAESSQGWKRDTLDMDHEQSIPLDVAFVQGTLVQQQKWSWNTCKKEKSSVMAGLIPKGRLAGRLPSLPDESQANEKPHFKK